MNVWMLDIDPVVAARQHCDKHVKLGPLYNAQALAYAWHTHHNEMLSPWDAPVPSPWFRYAVLPARNPALEAGSKPAPIAKSLFPGESLAAFWELAGQRVPSPPNDLPHVSDLWAAQLGGNYRWLWRLTSELVAEFHHRFKRRHPVAHCVWTLELMPPALAPTVDEWTETQLDIPYHMRVAADGFYDSVASCRRFYNIMIPPEGWTRRKPPAWHKPEHSLTIDPQEA